MHIGNQPPCLDCSSPIHLRSFKWCHYTDPPGYTIMRVEAHVAVHCQLCLCHDRQLTTIDLEVVECFDVFWPLCLWRPGLISQINPIKKNNLLTQSFQWLDNGSVCQREWNCFLPISTNWCICPENDCTKVTLGGYMPHPTVKIEIPKMAVDQNTRKILGVKIPFLSHLLVSMFVVSIPFPPGMLGPTSQSTLQIMEGTHKNIITHYIYTIISIYIVSTCA